MKYTKSFRKVIPKVDKEAAYAGSLSSNSGGSLDSVSEVGTDNILAKGGGKGSPEGFNRVLEDMGSDLARFPHILKPGSKIRCLWCVNMVRMCIKCVLKLLFIPF
jgi:hypothetical protein